MKSKLTHDGPVKTISAEEALGAANAPEPTPAKVETAVSASAPTEAAEAGVPTMYVKDHCPKCKGAEQRFKLAGLEYNEVNCSQNMDIARELNIRQTPTIIDPDGTRYEGDTAAVDWMKAHSK